MSEHDEAFEPAIYLRCMLRDARTGWNVGTFGAIAEFLREADEEARFPDTYSVCTPRGAIRIERQAGMRLVAYETPAKDPESWNHAIALCLPEAQCAMNWRTVLTELGPDSGAVDPRERNAILFDMGLGTLQADICVRSADPQVIERLRAGAGRSLAEPGNSHSCRRCRSSRRTGSSSPGSVAARCGSAFPGPTSGARKDRTPMFCLNSSGPGAPMPPTTLFRTGSSPARTFILRIR